MEMFRSNVSEQQYQTWFSPMRVKQYDDAKKELTVFTPSQFFFEYLEEHYRRLIHITISRFFGEDVALYYQVEVADNVTVSQESDGKMVVEHLAAAAVDQEDLLLLALGIEPERQLSALMVRGHEALMTLDDSIVACKAGNVGVMDVTSEQLFRRRENRAAVCSFICHCYSPCNSL